MIKSHDKSSGKKFDEDKVVDALTLLRFTRTFMEIQRLVDERNTEIARQQKGDEVLGGDNEEGGGSAVIEKGSEVKIFESQAKFMIRKGQLDKGILYVNMAMESSSLKESQVTKILAARSKYQILRGRL